MSEPFTPYPADDDETSHHYDKYDKRALNRIRDIADIWSEKGMTDKVAMESVMKILIDANHERNVARCEEAQK